MHRETGKTENNNVHYIDMLFVDKKCGISENGFNLTKALEKIQRLFLFCFELIAKCLSADK